MYIIVYRFVLYIFFKWLKKLEQVSSCQINLNLTLVYRLVYVINGKTAYGG